MHSEQWNVEVGGFDLMKVYTVQLLIQGISQYLNISSNQLIQIIIK